jgi:acyl-coenzyme A synthetase/AMP-(fatty) acid ligase
LWGAFQETVSRRGDAWALLQVEQRTSFNELNRRARAYAALYAQHDLKQHDRVLIWMTASQEMAAAMLGAWANGCIPVLLDPSERGPHIQHAWDTTSPAMVVTFDPPSLAIGVNAPVRTPDDATDVSFQPATRVVATDPASIVFTSGSTGKPKGATQSHGNLLAGCASVGGYLGITPDDRNLCCVPWAFDYGYGQLLSTIMLGVTQVLPEAPNPFAICAAIDAHQPTVLAGIPSLYTYLLQGLSPFRESKIGSLRILMNTGGTIPGPVLQELLALFPHAQLFLNYGLTETYRTSFLDPLLVRQRPDSIGKPIPGVDIVIVRDDGTLADPDEEGEIVHRGEFIFLGYWNNPEATARALRRDPTLSSGAPGRPVLYTGDYGVLDKDGFLYFRGRRDHQLKSMGVRVSPGEVEEMIHQSGLVREVAVFGMKHDMLGDEVWTALVARDGVDDVKHAVQKLARETMSPYMQPRRFLIKDALPKTRTGKTDYPALREEAAAIATASVTAP